MKYESIQGYLNAADFGVVSSSFETKVTLKAGSPRAVLEEIGDFKVGDKVRFTGGDPRCDCLKILQNNITMRTEFNHTAEEVIELRGWEGKNGTHVAYIIDIEKDDLMAFRFTDDLGRHWHEGIKITGEWQPLSGGLEVRFKPIERDRGFSLGIVMRSYFTATVEAIEGNTLILDRAPKTSAEGVACHSNTEALQGAIDQALAMKKNLFLPNGYYKIDKTLVVKEPTSFTLRGESAENTVLDIGDGEIGIEAPGGACVNPIGGTEFNMYDLSLRGGMGYEDRDMAGYIRLENGGHTWGFYFKKSNALCVNGTERVYVENCHARKMSAECFFSSSPARMGHDVPPQYTKSLTFYRCSVEDCARNAFNTNDFSENAHVIDCRIVNVGGCSWEGASRFVQVKGCYFKNAGAVAIGNIRHRKEDFEILGSGQHVVSDNTFEGNCPYGAAMIGVSAAAEQVIIRGNNFIKFNSNAIRIWGDTGPRDLPARNAIVSGNILDMTAEFSPSEKRIGINVQAEGVTVCDNQIYTNSVGAVPDENVTAISIRDDAEGAIVHDNLIHGVGTPIEYERCECGVGEVLDGRSFTRGANRYRSASLPPIPRRRSHRYAGWIARWENGEESRIAGIDPETQVITLSEERDMKRGDKYTLHPPKELRLIHNNLIF